MLITQNKSTIKPNKIAFSDFHAKLYAYELLRRCPSDSIERITAALLDSQVDLNPHQIDAAIRLPFPTLQRSHSRR